MFDGRTAENFKLNTGTWVTTGILRDKVVDHFEEAIKDLAITGADRDFLGALVFPNFEVLRKIAGKADASPAELVEDPKVRTYFQEHLDSLAAKNTGSSTLVKRILLVDTPPSPVHNEVTDKGSVNQRAVLANRADLVEEIYAGSPRLIEISGAKK
jgi:feruloyl-CoA synthase